MKYKVIGWVGYDDIDIEEADCSCAAYNAIIDDIKDNGYCFSGYSHQELSMGAPVLNDGFKRCFSQRGWGGLMAEAHGHTGAYDYSNYAYSYGNCDSEKMPGFDRSIDPNDIKAGENLNETFSLSVSTEIFEKAKTELIYVEYESPRTRYIDTGDTLELITEGNIASYSVLGVERGWNRAPKGKKIQPILIDEMAKLLYCGTAEEKNEMNKIRSESRRVLSVSLERK